MAARPTWPPQRAAERELHRAERQLARTPEDAGARFKRARLLDGLGRPEARDAYLAVLAIDNGQHLVPTARDIMFVVDELLAGTRP